MWKVSGEARESKRRRNERAVERERVNLALRISSECSVEVTVCVEINAAAPQNQERFPVSCFPAAE